MGNLQACDKETEEGEEKHRTMSDETPVIPELPKELKPDIFMGLPHYLKDPKTYKKIRKFLFDILASRCGHSDPLEWNACKKCLARIHEHAEAVEKLGFKSPAQYYQWRRVHETMEKMERDPLPKYNG